MSQATDTSTTTKVLALQEEEVSEFVRDAMTSKRLSGIIKDLNSKLLDGEPDQKARASEALSRLGFTM